MLKYELHRLAEKQNEIETVKAEFDDYKSKFNWIPKVTTYEKAVNDLAEASKASMDEIIKLKEALNMS